MWRKSTAGSSSAHPGLPQAGSKTAVGLEVGALVHRLLTERCGVGSLLLRPLKVLGWGREKALLGEEESGYPPPSLGPLSLDPPPPHPPPRVMVTNKAGPWGQSHSERLSCRQSADPAAGREGTDGELRTRGPAVEGVTRPAKSWAAVGVLLEEDLRYLWLVEHLGLKGPSMWCGMRYCQRMGEGGGESHPYLGKALCSCTQGPSLPS